MTTFAILISVFALIRGDASESVFTALNWCIITSVCTRNEAIKLIDE